MALLDFSYNPIAPPNSRETDWDEGQWLELASIPRFWPGFIQGFLSDPQIRKDMIEYFGELESIPRDKMVEILDDPIRYKDRLVNMIQDFQFDYEIWQSSDDPWHLILTMTPGFFEYTSKVVGDRIYYTIYEVITELTPVETPDGASQEVIDLNERRKNSSVSINQAVIRKLAKALGISLNVLINRREV